MPGYYFRHPKAKIIDLNKLLSTKSTKEAKFKLNDFLISKKILQNLEKVDTYTQLRTLDKFKNNMRKVIDIKSNSDGEIFYLLDQNEDFIKEEIILINYIWDYADNIWKYYIEKKKEEDYLIKNPPIKKDRGRPRTKKRPGRPKKIVYIKSKKK